MSLFITEGNQGKSNDRSHGEKLLPGSLLVSWSATFLTTPRTLPRSDATTVGWDLPHPPSSNGENATQTNLMRHFLNGAQAGNN